MALSYEFSIGSVRAKEKSLLSRSDLEQMIAMKDEQTLIRFLKDKNYGDGSTVEEILDSNADRMWHYIRSVAPEMRIFDGFLLSNDIHNFKTTLKGILSQRDYQHLLLSPCTIPVEKIKNAVEHNKFDLLPSWLSDDAQRSYQLLTQTKDARLSDAAADQAALKQYLRLADEAHSEFISSYFRTFVFYAYIKTAIRASRTKPTIEYLREAIGECDGFDRKTLINKSLSGTEPLLKYLENIPLYHCRRAIQYYRESPVAFEKYADNILIGLASDLCRITAEGPEPLFGYYIACEYERRSIYIITGGIRTQTPPEQIRERLRECYG